MNTNEIIHDYSNNISRYETLRAKAGDVLEKMIADNGFFTLPLMSRIKSVDSLKGKISKKRGKVTKLTDVKDLCGFRIITYFSDDADRIGDCIEQLFMVVRRVDKRVSMEPTQFGYLSLHYVCAFKDEDANDEIRDLLFEIQIRTILQHAWAEIEHDLGYKSSYGVPQAIRRNFSRVASLLEMCDEEFIKLRDNSTQYAIDVREKIINGTADEVPLDLVSLNEHMKNNSKMREYYDELQRVHGIEIFIVDMGNYLDQLKALGFTTLGDLIAALREHKEMITGLLLEKIKKADLDICACNIIIRYMCTAELIKRKYSAEELSRYYHVFLYDEDHIKQKIQKIMKMY